MIAAEWQKILRGWVPLYRDPGFRAQLKRRSGNPAPLPQPRANRVQMTLTGVLESELLRWAIACLQARFVA